MRRLALPIGHRSNRLTVIGDAGSNRLGRSQVRVRCDCGVEKTVSQDLVAADRVASCGCWRRARASVLNLSHGEAREEGYTPEYRAWLGMIARCERRSWRFFYRYGGRGIRVCERWRNSYEDFLNDVGRRPSAQHSIDRIDNDGNYEPGNVRWATRAEQARNKRNTARLTVGGVTRAVVEWAELSGIRHTAIKNRIKNGWDPQQAISQPSRNRQQPKKESDK